jgi:hypothetical protein
MNRPLAGKVTLDEDTMWVFLVDGRTIGIPLPYFLRLLEAAPAQHPEYQISGGDTGLHWDELGEDISVEHLLMGYGDRTTRPLTAR